ncbi:MAG: universal stress protein [Armatimonadota bacterium]|nr:universal stress protein [Armatimonadota bacterium]
MLVAVDLSPASLALVRFAAHLASRMDADLVLIHAYGADEGRIAGPEARLSADRLLERLRAEVDRLVVGSGTDPGRARIVIGKGQPADVILERASRGDVDLIVMGTHGRTGLQRLLVGSVAEGVLRRAPCPVVVVPYAMLMDRQRPPLARAGAS